MPLDELTMFALILSLGIFTQAATGFAGGLVIMPLMVWSGQGVPEAQAALLAATLPQNAFGVYRFRDTQRWHDIALPATVRMLAVPIGIAALYVIDGLPVQQLRQVVSGVIILCVSLFVILRPSPRERVPMGWTLTAFFCSGFFAGSTGTGGPFMVLWTQAHDWSTRKTRAFLFTMYLTSIPFITVLLYWTFGARIVAPFLHALLLVPLLLCVTWLGLQLGSWLGRHRLRRITMIMLFGLGAFGLLAPLFGS